METQKSYEVQTTGTLYLVPTPIGNLGDMTFRAVEVLKEVDWIASEDTRNTRKLLTHFDILTQQLSFHEHNTQERIPQLIAMLESGESIAQVSDAGMPSISDPGHELVQACIEASIPVVPLPGANAGITALIASGLTPQPFTFIGFLKRKKKDQRAQWKALEQKEETMIFYESPYRLKETIENLAAVLGEERRVVICRELTKRYEEFVRGNAKDVLEWLNQKTVKGEICLLVEGNQNPEAVVEKEPFPEDLKEHVEIVMQEEDVSSKDAIKQVAKLRNRKKQEVYQAYHEI
ncbi:16S rRNA (cytidine(1402)-2'-O)-methyltransferase [Jeotgalibaca ciconiae]|uniref:Ribosomal RNA small subunit methyltransferase I n=1 Tax=Jeotgalibaca ciconiae TaxID=2496265 RepID=A0A3Q9BK14_9LACT|nr:16S rRNA (cytidine(1402)-2'-O)-methyltransferase [Jeotgalibaca ciconiae]AZP04146.1 16S rRNA (cytidine(1402)-2'-O)-methyltransferase [Jeotgalibaca ciconiae]